MTKDRFFQIYKFLYLSDRNTELPLNPENYYMIQKIDPSMEDHRKNFQKKFIIYSDLSTDEAVIKYKG